MGRAHQFLGQDLLLQQEEWSFSMGETSQHGQKVTTAHIFGNVQVVLVKLYFLAVVLLMSEASN